MCEEDGPPAANKSMYNGLDNHGTTNTSIIQEDSLPFSSPPLLTVEKKKTWIWPKYSEFGRKKKHHHIIIIDS